jgi:hypothetical protein
MLSIDLQSFAEKRIWQVATSRGFRLKELMSQEIASVRRLPMTNDEAGWDGIADWKSEMKLFRAEDWTGPLLPGQSAIE